MCDYERGKRERVCVCVVVVVAGGVSWGLREPGGVGSRAEEGRLQASLCVSLWEVGGGEREDR